MNQLYVQPSLSPSDITAVTLTSSDYTVQKTETQLTVQFSMSNIVPINGNISIALPSSLTSAIPSGCTSV